MKTSYSTNLVFTVSIYFEQSNIYKLLTRTKPFVKIANFVTNKNLIFLLFMFCSKNNSPLECSNLFGYFWLYLKKHPLESSKPKQNPTRVLNLTKTSHIKTLAFSDFENNYLKKKTNKYRYWLMCHQELYYHVHLIKINCCQRNQRKAFVGSKKTFGNTI